MRTGFKVLLCESVLSFLVQVTCCIIGIVVMVTKPDEIDDKGNYALILPIVLAILPPTLYIFIIRIFIKFFREDIAENRNKLRVAGILRIIADALLLITIFLYLILYYGQPIFAAPMLLCCIYSILMNLYYSFLFNEYY